MDEHQFTMLMKKLGEIHKAIEALIKTLQPFPETFAEETRKLNFPKGVFGERF